MPTQSQALSEVLKGLVVAFGGATPTSDGLGELYTDLIAAVEASGGGTQGPQGNQGPQGFQGNQGFQGPSDGAQGAQGAQGSQGAAGSNGAQGAQGPQGTQGHQGTQGVTGTTGNQGSQGVQGAQGTQGFQGVQGNQGAQGGAGTGFMPISNTNGIGTQTLTPDPISGSHSATWVTFPVEQQALAFGVQGHAHPQFVFSPNATDVGLAMGDGSINPAALAGGFLRVINGANRGFTPELSGQGNNIGAMLGQGVLTLGQVNPTGFLGGEEGDIVSGPEPGSPFGGSGVKAAFWVCTSAGDSGSAVWEMFLALATYAPLAGGTTTPQNVGTLWLDLTDGGVWVSNGTAGPGNWSLLGPGVAASTVSVTSNAGTVPVTAQVSNFTNSSAATMAITMATAGALDGAVSVVRVYDFSGVAETIGWTNTENSTVSVPTTSAGSTTLPLTVTFQFNGATSKWRCIQSV